MQKREKTSFWALIVVQFFGSFNDNLLKILVQLLVIAWVVDSRVSEQLVVLASVVFAAPFILFSMMAGRVSDRYGKPAVIRWVQVWQLVVVAMAIASLQMKSVPGMMISIFLLAMQATFFSPSKYGILPELMGEAELSDGNGILNSATFVAILMGTIAATFLTKHVTMACALLGLGALAGLVFSFWIAPRLAAKQEEPWVWNPFSDLVANYKIIRQDRALSRCLLAANYFWFIGAILVTNIILYAKQMMHMSDQQSGYLMISVTVGIALGSLMAGRWSRGKVEMGLVPLGALGMSLFGIDLFQAWHSFPHALLSFFMIGFCGGLYEIPLNAMIQWRSPPGERGRVLATQNFLSFVAILIGSGALWVLGTPCHLNPAQIFLVVGLASLVGTVVVYSFLPAAVWRFVLYALTNLFYRIRIVNGEAVPSKGPALLVANHLSLVDGFLVGAAVPRLVRFLIWRPYYEARPGHWLLKTMKAIPISEKDPPKEILRSLMVARKALEEGELVCLFAEGQISRTGNLLEFKRGFEVIVKGLDVPVIPVHLDRVWGSIFSFEHGKVLFKRPRQIPYPVTVTFGEPLKAPITATEVRQAVLDLGADSFQHRLEGFSTLPIEFLRRAKQQPSVLAVADSSGKELSFGRLAAASRVFSGVLERILTPEPHVGILLPSSVGGALANVAVSLLGRVPVNLNYTAGSPAIDIAVKKAGITRILTSRKLLEKTGLAATPAMIYMEDLMPMMSKPQVMIERLLFGVLPTPWVLKRYGGQASHSLKDTATIMFSSGSTGVPKGVVLSHANILSNILGLAQVFDVGKRDRMVGVLPFFHSFGFTGTLWFPLVTGFSTVYHANPLEAKVVGEIAGRYKATLLLATPTFLLAYTRKCMPEQFQSLRYVIVGAERLRDSIARAFEEKFGKVPLEGYGCTELSPVATVNVPNVSMGEIHQTGHKAGKIGHPIPGVSVRIVNPDTLEPLPQGEKGLLLVKGPNVMQGYLDEPEKTAGVVRDGWYLTGDIALVDNDGFVEIVDRLSRFSKIAGEMVPHVLVEEKLHQVAGRTDPTFVVSAVPDEKKGEQLVVLCAGYEGSIEDLWKKLNESDMPKLWIPAKDRFYPIEALPYLGTGKLDLARLKALAKEKTEK